MFVIEHRDRPSVLFKDLGTLLEKLVAGILNLAFLIAWVVAMLADNQDCIHGQFRAACAQGFGDCRVDGETEFPRPLGAQVAIGFLIHIERDDLYVGALPRACVRIPHQESIAHVLAVREVAIDGGDDGEPLGRGRLGRGGGDRGCL